MSWKLGKILKYEDFKEFGKNSKIKVKKFLNFKISFINYELNLNNINIDKNNNPSESNLKGFYIKVIMLVEYKMRSFSRKDLK